MPACPECDDTGFVWEMILGEPEKATCAMCALYHQGDTTMEITPEIIETIFNDCEDLEKMLLSRGFTIPDVDFKLHWFGDEVMRLQIGCHETDISITAEAGDYDYKRLLESAKAAILALDSPGEIKKKTWLKQFGRIIDEGRDIGIDVGGDEKEQAAFNMMVEAMKRLSSNIVTDQTKTAAE